MIKKAYNLGFSQRSFIEYIVSLGNTWILNKCKIVWTCDFTADGVLPADPGAPRAFTGWEEDEDWCAHGKPCHGDAGTVSFAKMGAGEAK